MFKETASRTLVEREAIESRRIVFEHDSGSNDVLFKQLLYVMLEFLQVAIVFVFLLIQTTESYLIWNNTDGVACFKFMMLAPMLYTI